MKPSKRTTIYVSSLTLLFLFYAVIPANDYSGEKFSVYIAGSGNVSDLELLHVKAVLEEYFSGYANVEAYEKRVAAPDNKGSNYRFNDAFNVTQALTGAYFEEGKRILDIERSKGRKFDDLVIITDMHLFPNPSWNYVFGESLIDRNYRMCVLSTWYLKRDESDLSRLTSQERYLTRLKLISAHETGHTLGLYHVSDQKCLMAYTSTIEGLDAEGGKLCGISERKLRNTVPGYLCGRQGISSSICFLKNSCKYLFIFGLLVILSSYSRTALKKHI